MPVTAERWSELRRRYPNPARIGVAFELALDLETCKSLLRGEPVDPAGLDGAALARARRRRLVRLDVTAIDLLGEVRHAA